MNVLLLLGEWPFDGRREASLGQVVGSSSRQAITNQLSTFCVVDRLSPTGDDVLGE